jgi:hypothetical protein
MAYSSVDFEVVWRYHDQTNVFINTMAVISAAATSSHDVASAFRDALATDDGFTNVHSNQVDWDSVEAISLSEGQANSLVSFGGADHTGGEATGVPVPPNVSLVITLQTAAAGRRKRGRLYIGAVTENALDTSRAQWNPSFDAPQTAIDDLIDTLDGTGPADLQLCVNSRKNKTLEPIISGIARLSYIGSQRRRAQQQQ